MIDIRISTVSAEQQETNSTTVLMIPSDFVTLAKSRSEYLWEHQSDEKMQAMIEKKASVETGH